MSSKSNQTIKHYVKPTLRKMGTCEVLQKISRLRKILKDFGRNGSCTQYRHEKIKNRRLRKDVHVPRLSTKSYWQHISHVKSTHKKDCTNP